MSAVRNAQPGRVEHHHPPPTLSAAVHLLPSCPTAPSTPLVSQLCSHASAIRACRTLQTPTPPLAGGSAAICCNWFISPNFPGEHGVPIWCPLAWASESQVVEQCVKSPSRILPASAPRSASRSCAPLTPLCLWNKLCSRNVLSMASLR